jgi:uncharacterized protein (TIGR02284 family)
MPSTRPLAVNARARLTAIRARCAQNFDQAAASPDGLKRCLPEQTQKSWEKAMNDRQDEISTLNSLIATTVDSINGYEDSAKNIDNERFREIFRQRANERQQVVEDLRTEVRRLGGDPEEGGSFLGKAHQRFEDLKAAVTGRDEKAIINEVERGEDYLKEKFETALDSGSLSGETRAAVERCYQSVRAGHDQMSQLKHGMEASG